MANLSNPVTSSDNTGNTRGFEEFTIDSSHSLYVHPSDSPSSQLVSIPFNGTGFVHWRSSMVTSLSAKNKLGLITGKIAKPDTNSPLYSFWERCNDMVKAWIINSLTRDIAISVMCLPTAKEIWSDINDRFRQSNGSKYIQIQREISSTSQGSSDIATYFTKMKSLWDELSSAYVGPTCSCGALHKFIEDQYLFQFLSGLNDSYLTVKSGILMLSPLPSISKAYSLLQHDESQKESHPIGQGFSGDSLSFSASTSSNRTYNQKVNFDPKRNSSSSTSLFCKYCKRPGHVMEKCHKLHGYPPDFKFTKNKKSASCVQTDNFIPPGVLGRIPEPPIYHTPNSPVYVLNKEQYHHLRNLFHHTHLTPTPGPSSGESQATHGHANFADGDSAHFVGVCNMPISQYPAINSIVNCLSAQLGRSPWILDSGATNHMTPHKHFLHDIQPLSRPYLITLPNGYKVKVVSTGSLSLQHDITLGPSLKRPLEIGKADHGLYFLLPELSDTSHSVLHDPVSTVPSILHYDFSRVTWTHLLSSKSNAFSVIKAFATMVKVHFHSFVQTIRSDNAFELGGYPCGKKGYKLQNLSNHSIFFSRDVLFYEHIFPYSTSSHPSVFPPAAPLSDDTLPPISHSSPAPITPAVPLPDDHVTPRKIFVRVQ
ncbi:uncharacterized protein LOC132637387 [Lycium barbarum]|uniref:uncharacterized protein LOC132637387 n=1 Tax=Lycium barbarum TaxID=112863 RepID=UPI00293EFE22|nr:uncharacterized protein LOC132637387 [Lycium barbarum]